MSSSHIKNINAKSITVVMEGTGNAVIPKSKPIGVASNKIITKALSKVVNKIYRFFVIPLPIINESE